MKREDILDEVEKAEIGEEARHFIESELGKKMLDMADQQLKMAQEALETVDPENSKDIRTLQNKAQISRNFGEWLSELIDQGENALIAWKQTQNE